MKTYLLAAAAILATLFLIVPHYATAQALRVITAPQGGTGIGSATAGDIGNCLKVSTASPNFTYSLGSCGSGGGTGGLATTSPWITGQLTQVASNAAVKSIATSSLGLLTTDVAEGTNKYWTDTRFDNRLSATTSLPNITTLAGLSLPYSQLTGTPSIPTKTSDLANDSGFITGYTETDPIYSGDPAASLTSLDLTHLANLSGTNTGDQDLSGYALSSSLAAVATSGSYNDLTGTPTIPAFFGYPFPANATTTKLTFSGGLSTTYASTTAVSGTSLCIGSDCRTSWPSSGGTPTWGAIIGTLSDQTDLQSALDAKLTTTAFGSSFYTFFHATTTDALAQGSTNKYWSQTLFDNALSATTTLPNITTLANLGTVKTSLSGILKASSGVLSAAANGTDYTLVTGTTCSAGDFISAITAAGAITCGTPAGSTYTATYPVTLSGSAFGLAFGTTTSNTWAGTQTFTNAIAGSVTGNAGTVTNGVYTTDTGTVTNAMLAGSIANAKLLNSSFTINGTLVNLGDTKTITAASSTLLANNNTWSGSNSIAASNFNLTGLSDGCLAIASNIITSSGSACGSGGGGTSAYEIATTSDIGVSQLAYFNQTAGRTTLASVATSSATLGLGLTGSIIGVGAGQSLTIATSSLYTGQAGQFGYFTGANAIAGSFSGYASSTNQATLFGINAGGQNATTSPTSASTTAIGAYALNALTTGLSNTAVGGEALLQNKTGGFNTAVGESALFSVTTANNTAVGYGALASQVTGTGNTAVGYLAAAFMTGGSNNVALGGAALQGANTGSNNLAVGAQSLAQNTSGADNVAVGVNAGFSNKIGSQNTYVGSSVNLANTGSNNVLIGYQTGLGAGGTTTDNTFIGHTAAGSITTNAQKNVGIGKLSGTTLTSGYNNVLLGADVSGSNGNVTTGFNNITLGNNIRVPSATGNGQLNIGNIIFAGLPATTTGTSFTLPTSGTVGIGTSSPGAKFSIQANNGDTALALFLIGSSTSGATTTHFAVLNNGNVGVASTSPTEKLGVVGNALISGTLNALGGLITNISSALSLTIDGAFGIDTTSNQFQYRSNSATRVLGNGNFYRSFTYGTSTAWTGTTTIALGTAYVGETWNGAQCFTDAGTLEVQFNDGTNNMNRFNASTTVGTVTLSTNNTFTAAEKRYVDVGTPASSPTLISCSVSYSLTAD